MFQTVQFSNDLVCDSLICFSSLVTFMSLETCANAEFLPRQQETAAQVSADEYFILKFTIFNVSLGKKLAQHLSGASAGYDCQLL